MIGFVFSVTIMFIIGSSVFLGGYYHGKRKDERPLWIIIYLVGVIIVETLFVIYMIFDKGVLINF